MARYTGPRTRIARKFGEAIFGADKVLTALISGEADIGFMGAEASIYAYQEGATDPVVNFAQLTQRAGNFLVVR